MGNGSTKHLNQQGRFAAFAPPNKLIMNALEYMLLSQLK